MPAGSLRGFAALVAVACALVPAACSDQPDRVRLGDSSESPSVGASASTAGTRTITAGALTITLPAATDSAQGSVLTGYQAFWEGLLEASAKGDPVEPTLIATTTGAARPFFANYLGTLRVARRTQSGPVRLRPAVPSIDGPVATVTDCADLSGLRVRDSGGRPVRPPDPQTTQIRVELASQGAKWLVRSYTEVGRGCRPGP